MLAAIAVIAGLWLVLPDRPTLAVAQEKAAGVKWEYAELVARTTPGRPAGRDKDGNEVPPGQPALSIRWTTGADEVAVKGWDELGEKLKVQVKKEATATQHKIQALNALGAAGWEMVGQESSAPVQAAMGIGPGPGGGGFARPGTSTTWVFKRRVQ
jgi:hypothetical protein